MKIRFLGGKVTGQTNSYDFDSVPAEISIPIREDAKTVSYDYAFSHYNKLANEYVYTFTGTS